MRTGMDKTGVLVVVYGCLVFATVFIFSYLAIYELEYYLTAFALEFFLAILVTSPYNQAESRRQMVIGAMLIVIFIGIVVAHVLRT